jgi:hypothetical protein
MVISPPFWAGDALGDDHPCFWHADGMHGLICRHGLNFPSSMGQIASGDDS